MVVVQFELDSNGYVEKSMRDGYWYYDYRLIGTKRQYRHEFDVLLFSKREAEEQVYVRFHTNSDKKYSAFTADQVCADYTGSRVGDQKCETKRGLGLLKRAGYADCQFVQKMIFVVNRKQCSDTWLYSVEGHQKVEVPFIFARGTHTLIVRHDLDAYVVAPSSFL